MSLKPQDRLGPYEILASIGARGMGEVYKALVTRLSRSVAVKVSTEQVSYEISVWQNIERPAFEHSAW